MAMTNAERMRRSRLRKKIVENDGVLSLYMDEDDLDILADYGNRLGISDSDAIKALLRVAGQNKDIILPLLVNNLISHGHQVNEQNCLLANNNDTTNEDTMLRSLSIDIPVSTEKPKRGRKPSVILRSDVYDEPITPDAPAYRIAKTLYGIIKTRIPRYLKGRPIKLDGWAKSIRDNLLVRDHRDPKKVLVLLEWINTREPDLLRYILKPYDLREHYDFLMDIYNNNDFDPESDLWLNTTI